MNPETGSEPGTLCAAPDLNSPLAESGGPSSGVLWESFDPPPVCVPIVITPDDGAFVVSVPCLPGVVSEGDTEDEARRAIVEALAGALDEYGDAVPWLDVAPDPGPGERCAWVWVRREPGDAG